MQSTQILDHYIQTCCDPAETEGQLQQLPFYLVPDSINSLTASRAPLPDKLLRMKAPDSSCNLLYSGPMFSVKAFSSQRGICTRVS